MADLFTDLNFQNNPWFNMGAGILAESRRGVPTSTAIGQGILTGMENLRRQQTNLQQADAQRSAASFREFQMEQARQKAEWAQQQRQAGQAWLSTLPAGPVRTLAETNPELVQQAQARTMFPGPVKPVTKLGRLRQARDRGEITQAQYNALEAKELAPSTAHQSVNVDPTTGNVSITDKRAGTVKFIEPGGGVRTVSITGAAQAPRAEAQPLIEQPAEQQIQAPTVAEPEQLDPFEQQQWTRTFRQMPTEQQNKYTASNVAIAKIPQVIESVRANPEAFGLRVGGASLLPAHMQEGMLAKGYEEYQAKSLTSEQQAARGAVFREASTIIKNLAGAAVSEQERNRIEKFSPKETDDMQQILTKLDGALNEANTIMDTLERQFGLPARERPKGPDEGWQTLPDGTEIRWVK